MTPQERKRPLSPEAVMREKLIEAFGMVAAEPDAEIADLLWSENVSRPYSIDQHNAQIRKLYERMKAVRDAK